jgi:hypothetical protein
MVNLPKWLVILSFVVFFIGLSLGVVYFFLVHRQKQKASIREKNIIKISKDASRKQELTSIKEEAYYWEKADDNDSQILRIKGKIASELKKNEKGLYFAFLPFNPCFPQEILVYASVLGEEEKLVLNLVDNKTRKVKAIEKKDVDEFFTSRVDKDIILDLSRLAKDNQLWQTIMERNEEKKSLVNWMKKEQNKNFYSVLNCSVKEENNIFFLRYLYEI